MNKTEITHITERVDKIKLCLRGKIASDIDTRLGSKPAPLYVWDKFTLIKNGTAKLRDDLSETVIIKGYSNDRDIINCFTYPERPEDTKYAQLKASINTEKEDRELALKLTMNRFIDARVL